MLGDGRWIESLVGKVITQQKKLHLLSISLERFGGAGFLEEVRDGLIIEMCSHSLGGNPRSDVSTFLKKNYYGLCARMDGVCYLWQLKALGLKIREAQILRSY